MAATFSVAVVIKAIDRATAPISKVQAVINRARKPIDDVLTSVNKMSSAAGLPKLANAASGVAMAVGELGSALKTAAFRAVAIGGAVTGATYMLAKSSGEYGDKTLSAAQALGVSTDALQKWLYAARLAGVGNEALFQGTERLRRVIGAAASGNTAARRLFGSLGRDVFDAARKARPMEEILPLIADQLKKIESPYRRAYLAQKLFGNSAADVMKILEGGSAGLAAAGVEALSLGVVVPKEDLEALKRMNDALGRLDASLKGLKNALGVKLVDSITLVVDKITAWISKNRPLLEMLAEKFAKSLPAAFELAKDAFVFMMAAIAPLIAIWEWLSDTIGPAPALLLVIATVVAATLVPAIFAVVAALAVLSGALVGTPVGWVILAIVAVIAAVVLLVTAIYWLAKNWDKIWAWVKTRTLEGIAGWKVAFNAVWQFVKGWSQKIGSWIVGKITGAWEGLKSFFGGLWDWIESRFTAGYEWIVSKIASMVDVLPDWVKEGLGMRVSMPATAPGAPVSTDRLAAVAGTTRFESRAAIKVDFANMPKGTRVVPTSSSGADIDLTLGYSNVMP